jgi:hypothetical protein
MAEMALPTVAQSRIAAGEVVVYRRESGERAAHDHATSSQIVRVGWRHSRATRSPASTTARCVRDSRYVVPTSTVVGIGHARSLGIRNEQDLFGGVVPYPFVGTKSITHPLVAPDARAPHGWSHAFGRDVRRAVLDGFSAFSVDDAVRAGRDLLARGPVRIKRALAPAAMVRSSFSIHERWNGRWRTSTPPKSKAMASASSRT